MIDIHSHILPGVDDGAKDFEQALDMLRLAVENGVHTQVLTPHIQPGRYDNTPGSLLTAFREFKGMLEAHEIQIELLLSAEVRIGPEVIEYLVSDNFPWLGEWEGKMVFLLEFPHNIIPANSINLIKWLIKRGRLPMIVHPERNRAIQENPDSLIPYIEAGCLLQITSGSLSSAFGTEAMKLSIDLLQKGLVTSIASDCHNIVHRPPDLASGLERASELIGLEKAREMVTSIPQTLLSVHQNTINIMPAPITKSLNRRSYAYR